MNNTKTNQHQSDILTIRAAVARAKSEGFGVSEHALRQWIAQGLLPVHKSGNRVLIYYPNLIVFLRTGRCA